MPFRFSRTLRFFSTGDQLNSFTTARFPTLRLTGDRSGQAANAEPPVVAPTDEELLARIPNGDQEALACLFQRYVRVVRSIAARILGDAAEADDLVQDLFLFVQRKCSIFDSSKSSAGSWIVHMAYQRTIERRRYLSARHFYGRSEIESRPDHVVGILTVEQDYSAEAVFGRNGLKKVMAALSEAQRETLRLHFFDGYTLAEISAKLGEPLGNVRHHYYRGLDKLRKQMFGRKVRAG
jgi:RNA polymerase sigma-70 factor (ECF subfamily)